MRFAKWMLASMCVTASLVAGGQTGPVHLQVDNLDKPLGIDDLTPRFSWQLSDSTRGAKQTAYRVTVATAPESLAAGKADVWDSGKVTSSQSLNVKYAGPTVKASTRYFWRVSLWGADGKEYQSNATSSWETGLLDQSAWKAAWIGWETPEESAERRAPAKWIANSEAKPGKPDSEQKFAYRTSVDVDKPVKQAVLFATAEDAVSAWVNGEKALTAAVFPAYKHLPWKKFVRADVTAQIAQGKNTLAIESVHYIDKYGEKDRKDAPPMIATIVLVYADGTSSAVVSDGKWKSAADAPSGWESKAFDDASWKNAVTWEQAKDSDEAPVLQPWIPDSVKELRKNFDAGSQVKSARLYATALGAYEIYLNGSPLDAEHMAWMAPGWTDFRYRVLYQTYDVTNQVKSGQNQLSALLAPGWYSTSLEWLQQPNNYGDTPPALRAQLRIEHQDGSVEWVNSDASWKARPSYIVSSELYDGETQDLRRPTPDHRDTDADGGAQAFEDAQIVQPKDIKIEAQDFEPIRVSQILTEPKMTEPKPGVFIYDFGQNLAGVQQLKVSGPAGTDVQVRAGEVLNPDGTLYTENLRTARVTDHFFLSGNGAETLIPQFTFHGFRYIEVTGLKTAPDAKDVKALVLHTDFPFTTKLKTGSQMINKLYSNILWGQRSNFVGVPTDCPQRDERLGWSADAQVFWRAAAYNADLASFSRKFSADLRGTQVGTPYYGIYAPGTSKPHMGTGAAWSDAGVIIPWTSWIQSGDTMVIDENWQAMRKYVDAIDESNPDGIWHNNSGTPFGDWLSLEGRTKEDIVATAYWAYDVNMMRQMAHATGRAEEEQHYSKLEAKIRAAFEKKFVQQGGYVPGADNDTSPFGDINNPDAKSKAGDTQTGYVLALHMNLVPDAMRGTVAGRLAKKIEANHGLLNTGFVGTPYLLEELTKTGHRKLSYDVLLNTGMPSWGYVIEHGGTTTWERWNGDQMIGDPQMNSYNHYAYGAVADWIYRYAAGIDASPLDAGFHTVVLHPVFDARLSPLEFSYASSFGDIKSSWTVKGTAAEWSVTLPANTTGRLELKPAEAARWKLEGVAIGKSPLAKKIEGGFELSAGTYRFELQGIGE
ncbi:MAG: family 78 glycoside hydrolase catalytic domain [Acidobacteria bacterium]|nr:family 78 glycoside hydrolase catalytic domain [Acidobacteriota bacterium]